MQRALSEFGRSVRGADGTPPGGGGRGGGSGSGVGDGSGLNAPELEALPNTGFGVGNVEFQSRDFDWNDYGRQIYIAIWRAWHLRLYYTTEAFERWSYQSQSPMLDHQNRVRFTILRSGQVTGIALETPSGCVPLDDSAVHALTEVVLPPLPPEFPRDSENVRASFVAFGEIRYMRPHLTALHSRGDF